MKLRSMIGFCALAIAAFGLESNTCGLMNVPSTAATTMIAVPWLGVGGGSVKVANLVKTDTLTPGDELYYYDGANYYRWVLEDGAWTPSAVSNNSGTFVSPDAGFTIARGKGLFLVRKNPTTSEIWLYGENTADAASAAVSAGTPTAPAYNMIANPNTADYDLNAKNVKGAVGDQILLGNGLTLYTYGTAWTKPTQTTQTVGGKEITVKGTTTEGVVIPAGQGAWYISKGGSPTIAW